MTGTGTVTDLQIDGREEQARFRLLKHDGYLGIGKSAAEFPGADWQRSSTIRRDWVVVRSHRLCSFNRRGLRSADIRIPGALSYPR